MRYPPAALCTVLLAAGLWGCESTFDQTFVIDRLSVIGVQTAVQIGGEEHAELVFSTEVLRSMPVLPILPHIVARTLAVNPESAGGQDAIERYHWAIGEPPIEGLPVVVTTTPEVIIEAGAVIPALATLLMDGEELTPQSLADLLDEGPIIVPLVVTVIAGDQTATAVKMFTIRGLSGLEDEANRNPLPENLTMDWRSGSREWSEEYFEVIGPAQAGPYPMDRDDEVVFDVDPDDPGGDDGDVETTMYATAGSIGWSPESMRIWVQQMPGEDYDHERMRVFLVLRDPTGAQGWFTIEQDLGR